jgi:hypothetical protein
MRLGSTMGLGSSVGKTGRYTAGSGFATAR